MTERFHGSIASVALAGLLVLVTGAAEAAITDPAGDFLPSYTGTKGGDLDVLSAGVNFQKPANQLQFSATLNGAVGTTTGGIYVFGLDRGKGTEQLLAGTPSIGAGVKFDSVLVLRPDLTGSFVDIFNGGMTTNLPSGSVKVNGASISAAVALSLIPSTGQPVENWTFNLWPRNGLGANVQIADFAPDASNGKFTVTPLPAAASLLASGLAALGFLARRRPAT